MGAYVFALKEYIIAAAFEASSGPDGADQYLFTLPTCQDCFSKHKKSLFPLLVCGVSRSHNSNPMMFSGMGSLVLNKLTQHLKLMYEHLMRIHPRTSPDVVYFLSGCLPSDAILAMKLLSLLDMISRLGSSNKLFNLGIYCL